MPVRLPVLVQLQPQLPVLSPPLLLVRPPSRVLNALSVRGTRQRGVVIPRVRA